MVRFRNKNFVVLEINKKKINRDQKQKLIVYQKD